MVSRLYEMVVDVKGFNPDRFDAIQDALYAQWTFDSQQGWDDRENGSLTELGQGYLVGGESEEKFGKRVARAVWSANGAYCLVTVSATYLEDLPYDEYVFDEEDYEVLTQPKSQVEEVEYVSRCDGSTEITTKAMMDSLTGQILSIAVIDPDKLQVKLNAADYELVKRLSDCKWFRVYEKGGNRYADLSQALEEVSYA